MISRCSVRGREGGGGGIRSCSSFKMEAFCQTAAKCRKHRDLSAKFISISDGVQFFTASLMILCPPL